MLTDDEIMQQVLAAFQEEQAEHRQAIGDILLELEHDPQHPRREELVAQLFREAHSLKGGARAAGIEAVEHLAHHVEDLFSAIRQGETDLTADVCDPVYTAIEAIGAMMGKVSAGQTVSLDPYQALLSRLSDLTGQKEPPTAPTPASPDTAEAASSESIPEPADQEPLPPPVPAAPEPLATAPASPPASGGESPARSSETRSSEEVPWETASSTVRLSTAMLDSLMNETGELITCAVRAQQRARDARTLIDFPTRWRRLWRQVNPVITRIQKQQPDLRPTVHHLHDRQESYKLSPWHSDNSSVSLVQHDTVILLDALMQANALLSDIEEYLSSHVRNAVEDSARLSAVTNRMQDQIRRTRMLPLTTLLSPLRVQLREMARAASKQVVLEIDDGDAEADRQVLESLREVLLHLLRNAVDHGIEAAELRIARGKSPTGCISLRAVVSGDYLDITVSDDGAGLDIDAIKQRAVHEGLVNETDLPRVNDVDLLDLVFLPGFSTRQTVDKMSGRGVGLDVVRSQVERMHGQVSVQSTPGQGCIFRMRVPLSLTSSHGLLLKVGRGTYMLPLESIQRIVPVSPRDIHIVEGQPALIVDDHPLALIQLAELIGETTSQPAALEQRTKRSLTDRTAANSHSLALLLGSGERQVACLIDAVLGEQELVVHRLPAPLQRVHFIAGATILADGRVVPILDLVDLLRTAIGTRNKMSIAPAPQEERQHTPTVVVVDDSITTRTLEKNILEAAGYKVHLATDGVQALSVLHNLMENGGCDLLLSDIDMPNLNGFDLTSQVRSDAILKHLPIVLVTSLDAPADRERGLSAGADAYIVKRAFDQHTLLDTIAQLI
jgi:two-component system chemotaxis sensor kinase CheA